MEWEQSLESTCARGGWPGEFVTRPSAPPVYLTTAFDVAGLEQLEAISGGREPGYIYTRDGNPNHDAFAGDVARLEGAEAGMVAASGMGAFWAALLAFVQAGDHVLAGDVLYGRSWQLLNYLREHFGVQVTFADPGDPAAFARQVQPNTKLALVESITNPLMAVTDIPAIAAGLEHVPLLVDSTFATPCLLRPLELGARLVFHSASKYLNGHGDVMLGVVVGPRSEIRKIRGLASLFGMNANPMECWLASRGLRTLPLRMARVSQTAARLAEFLQRQPGVQRVYYPGLPDHPTHGLARRLLPDGQGGMLAFDLDGGAAAVGRLFHAVEHAIPFSPTLADARTTLSYPAGTSHKFLSATERQRLGIGEGLIRLSVGLEAPADLECELQQALQSLS